VGGSTTNPPAVARRVDSERGVAEEVGFLGGPDRLFACAHLPTGPSCDVGVVVCSPILCDFGANYRREVSLARRLAAAGVPALRYHPRGTGHSGGARTDLTLDTLVADATTVLGEARDRLGVDRLAVLATRFSALAAAEATRGTGTPLALWEPVTRPRSYLRAGLRARAVARLSGAGEREEPEDELARQGWIDVLGIPVGRGLYETPADRTLAAALAGEDRPLLVVRFEDGKGDLDLGVDVDVRECPCDESWWFIPDRSAPGEEAVAASAVWFCDLAAYAARSRRIRRHIDSGGGERPVFLPAATGDLMGLVTEPAGPANGLAAVFLRGAGWRPSSGPRRTQVAAARRLAAQGFHALRFSYHGIAESGGDTEEIVRLDRPYVADTRAAVEWAAGEGLRTVLVGNCFGARTALAAAAKVPDNVAGLVLSVPPVHDFEVVRRLDRRPLGHFARRLRPGHVVAVLRDRSRRRALGRTGRGLATLAGQKVRPRHDGPEWVSRRFVGHVEAAAERGIPMLFVFGEEDRYHADFVRARDHELGRVLDRAGDLVTIAVVPGRVHGLTSVATQEATLDAIEGWVRATCG
jgi:pimeloyl-ACP methyl ester carboxylesterase